MAENEILDVKGVRWRRTRSLLSDPHADAEAVASCLAEEFEDGLRNELKKCLRAGTPFLLIMQVAEDDADAKRRAVDAFKNKSLARIVALAVKQCGPPYFSNRIAEIATDHLLNRVIDRVVGHASTFTHFEEPERRLALAAAVSDRVESCRVVISSLLESSLAGRRPMPGPLRPRVSKAPIAERSSAVLRTSLLGPKVMRNAQRKTH